MSVCYIFQKDNVVLKEGRLPLGCDALCFKDSTISRGFVDRERPYDAGDVWLELSSGAVLPPGFSPQARRYAWNVLGKEQFFRVNKAFHIMEWERRRRFCGRCGARAVYDEKEFAVKCPECGELYYPEISPAVIVAVEKDGKILLAHGADFPPGRYSVIAGFVEPGERLAECVRREVYEEVKIRVKNIRYVSSQPWAFPRSLMIGFRARWAEGDICPDGVEITDAAWFAPDEIPEYYKGISISARLIEGFVARQKRLAKREKD